MIPVGSVGEGGRFEGRLHFHELFFRPCHQFLVGELAGPDAHSAGSPSKPATSIPTPEPTTSEIAPGGKNAGSKGCSATGSSAATGNAAWACGNFSRSFLRSSSITAAATAGI